MSRGLPLFGKEETRRDNSIMAKWLKGALSVALAAGIGFAATTPAGADSLDDRKNELSTKIAQSNKNISAYTNALDQAEATLQASRAALAEAQARLAKVNSDLASAQARHEEIKDELAQAKVELDARRFAVSLNTRQLERQKDIAGQNLRVTMQQPTQLMGAALLIHPSSSTDFSQRAQWSSQVFNASQNQMDILSSLQFQLDESSKAAAELVDKTADLEAEAKQNVADLNSLRAQAAEAEADVAALVQQDQAAQSTAAKVLADEEKVYAELKRDSARVDAQIQERIRKQKAEEERKRAKAAAAAAAKAANNKKPASGGSSSNSSGNSSSSSSSSSGLIKPVPGRVTSPYGMRLHPILKVWKLHDGVDFGASCGTPIKAAAAGVVTNRYYNAGYGNRLIIDHGKINGHYLTTSYNHATHYIVKPGQHVAQGQTVGYVGSTGYSTGCHLHFMAWRNGKLINPMTLL